MATLSDVARLAGVSITTVSHVVNDSRRVSPQARERVLDALAKTGYRPNTVARALRRATTESIGFVASDISNPYSTAVIRGIELAARKAGHTLLVATSDDDPDLEQEAIQALNQRRVDGLIIAPTTGSSPQTLEQIKALSIPVVLIDQYTKVGLDQVLVDNTRSVRAMVGHLIDLGHTRVGMVAGLAGVSTTKERVTGWRGAHEEKANDDLLVYGGADADAAAEGLRQLMALPEPPTAVFCGSNTIAVGVIRALKGLKLRVPQDVAVASFDDFEWADAFEPRLTVIAQPTFEIGREAVRLLTRRLADPARRRVVSRLRPILVHRDSCGTPAQHKGVPALPELA